MREKGDKKNIATIHGRVNFGLAIGRLVQWTEILSQNQYKIYIAARVLNNKFVSKKIEKLASTSKSLELIYDSEFLKTEYPMETIRKREQWLDIPFDLLISCDRRNKREIQKNKNNLKEAYNFIAGYIMFLKDFFSRHDIDYFIGYKDDTLFNAIPIFVAKKMDITRILVNEGRFPDPGTTFCRNNFSNIYLWNDDDDVDWEEITSKYENLNIVREEMTRKSKFIKIPNIKRIIKYYDARRKQIKISKYEKYTIPNNLSIHYNNAMFIVPIIREIYNRIFFQNQDSSEKYFFMPLHYVEDAQITLREPFVDQFNLISAISKTLPVGVKLYIKPHPHYKGSDISIRNLSKISKLKNVKIINPSIPVYDLIKNSLGVMTVSSTTGFEALIFNKPLIVFGHDSFCREDLCYLVWDMNKLPIYIMNIINGKGHPSGFEHIKKFVKKVYKNTFFASKSYMWVGPEREDKYFTDEKAEEFALILDKIIKMENEGNPKTIESEESLFGPKS